MKRLITTSTLRLSLIIGGLLVVAMLMGACFPKAAEVEPTVDANLIATNAVETVAAVLTSTAAAQPTATLEPTAEPTATLEPTEEPTVAPTEGATATTAPTATVALPTKTVVVATVIVNTPTPTFGVALSSYSLEPGHTFTASTTGFPKNVDVDFILYKSGATASQTLDGTTDSTGKASVTMTIPLTAAKDEKWYVKVYTTELSPERSATSSAITIKASGTTTTAAVVVSDTSPAPTNTITVTVTGFPKNASIDFQLGKEGAAYSVVADGTTDANGAASTTMTIPGTAVAGEKWVVKVITTELVTTISKTSQVMTIE